MNTSAQQRLNRLAASLGIGFVMLVVGWWCLTIEPAAANGRAVASHPLPLTSEQCATVSDPVYEPSFNTGSRFGAGTDRVTSLAVGDLDLDGDLDLVMGRNGETAVHFNDGQGDFTSAPDQTGPGNQDTVTMTAVVADMSRDGALDIVMASQGQTDQVLVNDGRGKFSPIAEFGPVGSKTTAIAVGDLNGDAAFDIVAGYTTGPGVVYRNITPTAGIITPTFEIFRPFGPPTGTMTSLAIGDLNNDGEPDIVAAHADGNLVVYWNDGLDSYPTNAQTTTLPGPGGSAMSLALVDLDGQHGLDIVAAYPGIRLGIFLNNGQDSRTFAAQSPICLTGTDTPVRLAAGDVDSDGRLDLVAGLGQPTDNSSPTFNRVFLNRSQEGRLEFARRNFGLAGSDDTRAVALADLNDDGALDLVTGNYMQQSSIFFNGGEGTLRPIPITTGKVFIDNVAVGDVDGKNGPDIVAGSLWEKDEPDAPPRLTVYHNDQSGAFSEVVTQPFGALGVETRDVVLGDVDNDGALDIVAAVAQPGMPNFVYINDGTGTFTSHEAASPYARPFGSESDNTQSLALGDIDRDGDLDIVSGNKGAQNAVHLNDGSGHFTATNALRPFGIFSGDTTGLNLGDIDGDGYLDVVVGNRYQPAVIYLNDTSGGFPEKLSRPIGEAINNVQSVAIGDVNGDGALDLALGSLYGANLVYTNDGKGNYDKSSVQALGPEGNNTYDLAFGDINGDGALDLATTQWNRPAPHRVFLNDGHGHFSTAHSRALGLMPHAKEINPRGEFFSRSLDLADVNRDGTLDIVTGDMYPKASKQHLTVYLNPSRQAAGLLDHPPTVAVDQPVQDATGNIPLSYQVEDRDLDLVRSVITQVVPPARQSFLRDILTSTMSIGTGLPCPLPDSQSPTIAATGQPIETAFSTDFFGTLDDMVVRLKAYPSYCPQPYRVPGPYQWPYGTATTPPFSIRGRTIQVNMDSGVARDQTVVYRLPKGESRGAMPLTDAQGDIYHPGSDGRLKGQGELHVGDQLMAIGPTVVISPHMPSQTYTSPGFQPTQLYCHFVAYGSQITECYPQWLQSTLAISETRRIVTATLNIDLDVFVSSKMRLILDSTSECSRMVLPLSVRLPNTPSIPGTSGTPVRRRYSFPIPLCGLRGAPGESEWMLTLELYDINRWVKQNIPPQRIDCRNIPDPPFGQRWVCTPVPDGPGLVHAVTIDDWTIEATLSPLYYTSAPLTDQTVTRNEQSEPTDVLKPAMTTVSGAIPTQTLTISQDNPLLLFDLTVALEWDARSDRQFMEQLSANLRRASELLYDWSNGQAALGRITVYHDARAQVRPDGTSPWSDADVRVFATNRLRPNSAQGGIVSRPIADPKPISVSTPVTYVPGSVNIAATWNRYGDTTGNLGEDWPRALAHELGHYLFFLNDNYIGVDERGLLEQVSGCAGVMADPYRTDDENGYGEYHAGGEAWQQKNCAQTLSYIETGRSDWETISAFYPRLKAPTPSDSALPAVQRGPDFLPIEVTQVSEVAPPGATTARELPVFALVDTGGGRAQPGSGARAFLFKRGQGGEFNRVVDLGRPRLDQVLARGAQPDDLLCVVDPEKHRTGCRNISAAGSDDVEFSTLPDTWQPDVTITPLTAHTLAVTVTGLPVVDLVEGQLFPLDGEATEIQAFWADGTTYTTTFNLADDLPNGHLALRIRDGASDHRLVTDLTLGGSPAFVRGKVVFAPVLSNDGQVLLYGPDLALTDDQIALLHAVTQVPEPPPWATVIGHAYRLAASRGVDLAGTSLSFSYLGNEVPPGEEGALNVYHWTGESWERLETVRSPEQNVASAAVAGEGLYALMSSTEISLPNAGWNLFGYPVPLPVTRTVTDTLASAGISFTVAFGYDPSNSRDPWRIYVPGAPEVSDLHALAFGHGYFIHTPVSGTLRFKGVSPFDQGITSLEPTGVGHTADLTLRTPPAFVYGKLAIPDEVTPAGNMAITAAIGGTTCGQGQTFMKNGETWYAVKVQAVSDSSPGCGLVGEPVTFTLEVADRVWVLEPTTAAPIPWDNSQPQAITMTLRSPATSSTKPPANCTELISNGGFESHSAWRMERTATPATYTTRLSHEGNSSARLGLMPSDPPGPRTAAISSAYQFIRIPGNARTATLSLWYLADAVLAGQGCSTHPPAGRVAQVAPGTTAGNIRQ